MSQSARSRRGQGRRDVINQANSPEGKFNAGQDWERQKKAREAAHRAKIEKKRKRREEKRRNEERKAKGVL